jgi:predicted transcriptional regulator
VTITKLKKLISTYEAARDCGRSEAIDKLAKKVGRNRSRVYRWLKG